MSTTMTESWYYGYVADDGNGHQGAGSTPEDAQAALEQAQRDNVPSAECASITGLILNNDHSLA